MINNLKSNLNKLGWSIKKIAILSISTVSILLVTGMLIIFVDIDKSKKQNDANNKDFQKLANVILSFDKIVKDFENFLSEKIVLKDKLSKQILIMEKLRNNIKLYTSGEEEDFSYIKKNLVEFNNLHDYISTNWPSELDKKLLKEVKGNVSIMQDIAEELVEIKSPNQLAEIAEDADNSVNDVITIYTTIENIFSKSAEIIKTDILKKGTTLGKTFKNSQSSNNILEIILDNLFIKFIITIIFLIIVVNSILGFVFYFVRNKMLETNEALDKISAQVLNVSKILKTSSTSMSEHSQIQAASVQETTSSLEEFEQMNNSNVSSLKKANNDVKECDKFLKVVDKSVQDLKVSFDDILNFNNRIKSFTSIIKEIETKTKILDEIVFQTKLLSFNASVEAERAGENGRGFAVVAQEVGNLANMSSKSAKEISEIVKISVSESEEITSENENKIKSGNKNLKDVSSTVVELGKKFSNIVTNSNEVSNALKDQHSGIKQINIAMHHIDKVTQETLNSSDRVATTSSILDNQTKKLATHTKKIKAFVK